MNEALVDANKSLDVTSQIIQQVDQTSREQSFESIMSE
jgi:hypothetical protein